MTQPRCRIVDLVDKLLYTAHQNTFRGMITASGFIKWEYGHCITITSLTVGLLDSPFALTERDPELGAL